MANTRSAAKRARQAVKRNERNLIVKTTTKTAVRKVMTALQGKNLDELKAAYAGAVQALSKAASKGAIPKGRAARKISRLTHQLMKSFPEVLPFKVNPKKAPKAAAASTEKKA